MNPSTIKPIAAGLILSAIAAVIPPLTFFHPKAVPALVVAAAIGGLVSVLWRGQRPAAMIDRPLVAFFSLVVIWAAMTVFWSLDTWVAARGVLKIGGSMAAGVALLAVARCLTSDEKRLVGRGLMTGMALILILLTFEGLTGGDILNALRGSRPSITNQHFWLFPAASIVVMLAWPLAACLAKDGRWLVLILAVAGVLAAIKTIGYFRGDLALGVGIIAAALVFFSRRWAVWTLAAVIGIGVFLAPVVPTVMPTPREFAKMQWMPKGMVHRLYIWDYTADRVAEHPVRGWGMNAARLMPDGKKRLVDDVRGYYGDVLPLHPHNFALQTWLELGLPGATLLAFFVISVPIRSAGSGAGRMKSALNVGQFFTAICFLTFGFSLWQSWWVSALWLSAALSAAFQEEPPPSEQ
jgi:exopolysaccharide production protein ExoQ